MLAALLPVAELAVQIGQVGQVGQLGQSTWIFSG
jgi:hypothetical protein